MELLKFPNEIFLMILNLLDLEDQFNLSLTNRSFQCILRSDGICKLSLQKHASFSSEFRDAQLSGQYAKGWRQITKRKIAIQTANPFLVAIVALADRFIYKNGALVYNIGQEHLRILLLQGSATAELGVDPQQLLQSIEPFYPAWGDYRLNPLHYDCGIVSLLAQDRAGAGRDFLITLDIHQMRAKAYLLATSHKIFVRNNESYLYYGVRSHTTSQNPGCWTLREIKLKDEVETEGFHDLSHLVGEDIGSNACFEIFDGYFYAVSSEQIFDTEPRHWNSFYYVFRFPLGSYSSRKTLPWSKSWRRHANEGSTDNRWSSLELSRDERSGGIFIYETRKEWSPQAACSQRNCYRKEIKFVPEDSVGTPVFTESLERELGSETYFEDRLPGSVHNGDSGSQISTCTYMDSSIRSYNPTARSFVDLVNDPIPETVNKQRLRLRVRSITGSSGHRLGGASLTGGELFKGDSDIRIWPPESPPGASETQLNRAFSLMNPQPSGRVNNWTTDDRHIIYSVGEMGVDSPSPIVIISFDPRLRLPSLPRVLVSQEKQTDLLQSIADLPQVVEPSSTCLVAKVQPLYSFLQGKNRPPLGLDLAL